MNNNDEKDDLVKIAIIVVAVIVGVIIVITAVWLFLCYRRKRALRSKQPVQDKESSGASNTFTSSPKVDEASRLPSLDGPAGLR